MKNSRSIFAVPFVFVAVMAGCMGSPESESDIANVEEAIVDESGAMPVAMQSEIQVARQADDEAFALVPNAAWKEIAPGVFEGNAEEGSSRIVVGAEGHKWAIEQAEKEISNLREQSGLQADEDPAVIAATKQLAGLKNTAQNIAAPPVGAPQAVSCNIGFYNGPSSSVTGYAGASALAQVSCSGGCQTFSIATQACTNFGCTGVYSASRYVCATPWTYGVSRSGSYGASCSSAASVSPPGITSSWNGFCG